MAAVFVLTTDGASALATYNGTVLAWLNTLTLHTYSNNRGTPLPADHLASYTESAYTGYASQAANDWVASGIDGNGNYLYTFPDHVFTQTGTGTTESLYGAYWTEPAGSKLALVQSRASALAMDTTGNTCTVKANPGVALGQLSGSP